MHHQEHGETDEENDDPYDEMEMERRIANEIMEVVNQRGLPLILDKLTEGKGNCFPLAILDQCKRPEIIKILPKTLKAMVMMDKNKGQMKLRIAVNNFMQKSTHPNVTNFKAEYQKISKAMNENWEQYWARLMQDKVQVDYTFIQSTAWYLKHDIMIVNTTNTDENPVIVISGNIADENMACPGGMLTIGAKSNCHYQSLLPIEIFHLNSEQRTLHIDNGDDTEDKEISIKQCIYPLQSDDTSTVNSTQNEKTIFIYKNKNTDIEFILGPDGLTQCYSCKKFCKSLIQHIKMSKNCNKGIVIDDFKSQYHIFHYEAVKEKNRSGQANLRQVRAEKDPAGLKQDKSRQVKLKNNPVRIKQ